jgi:hypothetical protein
MLRHAAIAVWMTIASTSFAQSKTGLDETNLLKPVTFLDFGLWQIEQKIERLGPEYTATASNLLATALSWAGE